MELFCNFCLIFFKGEFSTTDMMDILRDERSGICMVGAFTSTGSQVSVLPSPDSNAPPCHWFTGTPNPALSVFKPFIFTPNLKMSEDTKSPEFGDADPRLTTPRFEKEVSKNFLINNYFSMQSIILNTIFIAEKTKVIWVKKKKSM